MTTCFEFRDSMCTPTRNKTDIYHDLYKPQHVLNFLIICKHPQNKTGEYHDLYNPEQALDFPIVCTHM